MSRTAVVVAVLSLAGAASATERDPYVAKAEALMDEAEYQRAREVIDRGLARRGLDGGTLKELYLLEGTVWVSLGQGSRARSSYAKLLTLDPSFRLDERASRKVRDELEHVRGQLFRSGALEPAYRLEHTPLGNVVPGQSAEVRVALADEARAADVARVVLFVRRLGTSDFASIDAEPAAEGGKSAFLARMPPYLIADEPEPYAMEYFVDAYAKQGDVRLSGAGSADIPLSFLVVPKAALREEGLEEEGFPFVPVAIGGALAAGAVLAAVVVGAVFLLRPKTGSATVVVTQETP